MCIQTNTDITNCRAAEFEAGEDLDAAVYREALEEAGCKVELTSGPLAQTIEVRGYFAERQISVLFTAKSIEEGKTSFTEDEINDGYKDPVWVSMAEAVQLFRADKPKTYLGKFMHARDLAFLEYMMLNG